MQKQVYGQNGRHMGGRRRNKSEEQRQKERYMARGQSALHLRPTRQRKGGKQPKLGMENEAKKSAAARRRARARSEPPKKSRSRSKSKPKRRRSPSIKRRRTPSPEPQPARGRSPSPVARRPVRERDRPQEDEWAKQGAAIGGESRREAQRQWGYGRETSAEAHARRNKKAYDLTRHVPSPSPPRAPAPVVPQPQAAPVLRGPERTGYGQKEYRGSKDARDLGITRAGELVDPQDVYRRPIRRRRVSQMRSLTPEDPETLAKIDAENAERMRKFGNVDPEIRMSEAERKRRDLMARRPAAPTATPTTIPAVQRPQPQAAEQAHQHRSESQYDRIKEKMMTAERVPLQPQPKRKYALGPERDMSAKMDAVRRKLTGAGPAEVRTVGDSPVLGAGPATRSLSREQSDVKPQPNAPQRRSASQLGRMMPELTTAQVLKAQRAGKKRKMPIR